VALSELHGFAALDLNTDKVVQRVELPKLPPDTPRPYLDTYTHGLALTPDEKEIWVTSVPDSKVYAFSIPALQPRGEVAVGKFPNWLAFTPDGKTLFVSNAESNTQ
jgi:DNA-binding beta-propeller fold protein YncE